MDDLIVEFITETNESLGEIDAQLVNLEQNPNDTAMLGSIFRLMHTIKGTCGFLGLPRLEKVAHHAENVLGRFRDGDLEVTPEYVTLIFESIDRIKFIMAEIEEKGTEPEGDDSELIEKLDAVYEGRAIGSAPAEKEAVEEGIDPLQAIWDATPAPDDVIAAAANIDLDTQVAKLRALAAEEKKEESKKEEAKKAAAAAPAADGESAKASVSSQTLRVNVDALENLMTMVSELVLTRNQLLQILRATKDSQDSEFGAPLQRLNHVVSDLQEGVMQTRMQPIGSAWAKLPRIIRDLSIELGKKIDLQMIGQDTELDRQVLDLIKDPLTHMVRNSGDHGVETPEERIAAGKPETGVIVLRAFHEGGHIIIEIKDDGKGLNTERIKEKILEKGLATFEEVEAMPKKQIHQFVFAAGFSTAAKVTSVSGRGVGMDVVRTNIEKIGGTIDLNSEEGKGSTFTIKIPLTLAIVSALIVGASGERYAIPQLSIQELVMGSDKGENRIEEINGTPVFRLRDHLLPLVPLSDLLKLPPLSTENADDDTKKTTEDRNRYIVVTKVGSYVFGIIVDRVFDTEEIVVKPVASILSNIELFSGNTILGDGSVIMILDPGGVAKTTGELGVAETSKDVGLDARMRSEDENRTSLLLFTVDGQTVPKAVPLSLVARLEEVDVSKIEHSNGQMLIQYRDTLMPLIKFHADMPLKTEKMQPTLVFSDGTRSMGLMVSEIIDIIEERINVQINSDNAGFLGSAIIAGKTTDILDVGHYLGIAYKDWFKDHGDDDFDLDEMAQSRRVLIVDDSPFFRNMLSPLLSVAGYSVTTAENPLKALEMQERGDEFDVIISDIEMPEMNGFEFAEKIKDGHSRWNNTPMVALTSHATERDMARGREVGFVQYVAKFDRDTLLNTLSETLADKKTQERSA